MNSEKITQAEIEMMKGNKEAFCFWPEHLRAWAIEHWSFMEQRHKCSWQLPWYSPAKADDAIVLRLRPDFQLPVERWIFWVEENTIEKIDSLSNYQYAIKEGIATEVHAEDVEYVKNCIEIMKRDSYDWEYKMTTPDCVYINYYGEVVTQSEDEAMAMRFVRRPVNMVKPDRFVEYPITVSDRLTLGYRCTISHAHNSEVPLHKLPSIVGFAGIWFDGQKECGSWCMNPTMLIDEQGALHTFDNGEVPLKPAVPMKARYEVKETP